ncbi:MAG: hypothetical protein AUG51_02845 [Acidobacteria bacterium 13_1_20CM_3_53_8]|nr:MAG: hypothetical protein AUG51_02845 [Acidobacteria bacterium 13_1_20CM_3_53_8]
MTHRQFKAQTWWGPVWRGLVVDREAHHYRRVKSAIWLFLYLIIHADRKSGTLIRKYQTIAGDMGIAARTIRRWLLILRQYKYVEVDYTGRSLIIHIQKWRSIATLPRVSQKR